MAALCWLLLVVIGCERSITATNDGAVGAAKSALPPAPPTAPDEVPSLPPPTNHPVIELAESFACGNTSCKKGQYCEHVTGPGAYTPGVLAINKSGCVPLPPACLERPSCACMPRGAGCAARDGGLHLHWAMPSAATPVAPSGLAGPGR